jgi:flagellin
MQVQSTGGSQLVTGTNSSLQALKKTNQALEKILDRLSTAKRINSASDDAAGLGIAEQLTTQIRGYKQASQNISDASAALDIADGAGNEITSMVQRQRDLAVQAGNGTLNAQDRQALNTEYQSLSQEITRTSEVTNYNNQQVTNGTGLGSGNAQIQVGPNAGDTLTVPNINFEAATSGMKGTSIDTAEGAQAAISASDTALQSINNQRSTIGATVNQLTSAGDNLANAMTNTQAAESVIGDEDMATGLAQLTQQQILQEGAIKTFSRYTEITQNHILGLLQ